MKKLIIFDLDGTILNTIEDLHNSVNYALKVNNYPLQSLEHTRVSIGDGVKMLMRRSLPSDINEEKYQKALSDFESHYSKHRFDKTSPYKGVKEVLENLKDKGYLLAVSTNKLESIAIELVNKFYPSLFSSICGDNGKRNKKPSPDSINEIKNRLNITSLDEVTYIGDSEVDYLTSINGKANPIIVSYGYRTKEELMNKIPSNVRIVSSLEEILNYF